MILLFSLVRMKIFAVVLGTEGVGIMSFYTNFWEIAYLLGGLGISQSGVRYIAEARSGGDQHKLAIVVSCIQKWVIGSGLITLLIIFLFREKLSWAIFNEAEYTVGVFIVGFAILFQVLAEGEKSILLGYREVKRAAFSNGIGIIIGTSLSVLLVFLFKSEVLPWVLVLTSLCAWLFMKFQNNQVLPQPDSDQNISPFNTIRNGWPIVQLGLVLVGSSFLTSLVFLLTKRWIQNQGVTIDEGNESVGLFEQSYRVSAFYVNFVLGAMAADFLPRLTESIKNKAGTVRIVNEQIEVGILLVISGIAGLILFKELILTILATKEFVDAAPLITWFALGCLGRVMTWPVAYLFVAAEKKVTFLIMEVSMASIHLLLAWFFVSKFQQLGGAMAFTLVYLVYGVVVIFCANKQFGYKPNVTVVKLAIKMVSITGLILLYDIFVTIPQWMDYLISSFIIVLLFLFAASQISALLPEENSIRRKFEKLPLGKIPGFK